MLFLEIQVDADLIFCIIVLYFITLIFILLNYCGVRRSIQNVDNERNKDIIGAPPFNYYMFFFYIIKIFIKVY
jgi:hypothetical protein